MAFSEIDSQEPVSFGVYKGELIKGRALANTGVYRSDPFPLKFVKNPIAFFAHKNASASLIIQGINCSIDNTVDPPLLTVFSIKPNDNEECKFTVLVLGV